jgi:CRP/FNR family transcriptional regulator
MIHSRNAIQRVRKILIQLSDGYGETRSDGLWLNVKLTHQSIADMSGLTREAVTRVFDRLQKEGEVLVNKDRTITLRPSLLKGLSLER